MPDREMTSNAQEYVLKKMYIVNTVLILCHLAFAIICDIHDMTILFFANLLNIAICLLAFVCLKKRENVSKRPIAMGIFNIS